MRGLLVKDMRLLLNHKSSYLIFVAIGILLMSAKESSQFASSYIMMLSTLLCINTIVYDYNDNGMQYIMTMPIKRSYYAIEKYLLSLINIIFTGLITPPINIVIKILQGKNIDYAQIAVITIMIMLAGLIMTSLVIPVNIKYGPEKGRIALLILLGVAFSLIFVLTKLAGEAVMQFFENINIEKIFENLSIEGFVIICIAVVMLFVSISAAISVKIINKKEF